MEDLKLEKNYVALALNYTFLNDDLRIIEVGAIKVINGIRKTTFFSVVEPEKEEGLDFLIYPEFSDYSGLKDEDIKKGIKEDEAKKILYKFIGDLPVVLYNDPYLIYYLKRNNKNFKNKFIDLVESTKRTLHKEFVPSPYEAFDKLKIDFTIKNVNRAFETVEGLVKLYEKLDERGKLC